MQQLVFTLYVGGVLHSIVESIDSLERHGTRYPLKEGFAVNLAIALLWPLRLVSAVALAFGVRLW